MKYKDNLTHQTRKPIAISIDWDGTLGPIIHSPKKARPLNQWDIVAWLYPQDDKRAKAWNIFQKVFVSWAYKDYRFDDIPLYKVIENLKISDINNSLVDVFDYTHVLYKELKSKYSDEFKNALYKTFEPYTEDPKKVIREVFEISINDIFISHIKDALWALASFEFYYKFNVSTDDLDRYAKFFVKFIHKDRLSYIISALQNDYFVLINTLGIKEVSWNILNYIFYKEYRDKIDLDSLVKKNKLKTTAFKYIDYLENRRLNGVYSYKKDWILPSNKIISTAVGRAIRMLIEGDYRWIACGDSSTYDVYMVKLAKFLTQNSIKVSEIPIKTDIVSKHEIICNI